MEENGRESLWPCVGQRLPRHDAKSTNVNIKDC